VLSNFGTVTRALDPHTDPTVTSSQGTDENI
jgi:hypothetical protein